MAVQGTVVHRPWVPVAASVVLTGAGVFLFKTGVLDVLAAAERHDPQIRVSMKAAVLSPTFVLLGILALVGSIVGKGQKSDALSGLFADPTTRKLKPAGWAFVIVLLAIGGGSYFWMQSRLEAYGYSV
jgi:hypothetical protein